MRIGFIAFALSSLALAVALSFISHPLCIAWLILTLPLIALGTFDVLQTRHTVWRNFPVLGHIRNLAEFIRPALHQYFIESDIDGVPINRMFRSVVYQRAKRQLDTLPLGTKMNVYEAGYEWLSHSINAKDAHTVDLHPRVLVGGPGCKQPYQASILNISAMSYGALSDRAILALNGGAKLGNFAHNTGEGGLSDYHLQLQGDLIWQIGTGYFGCRDANGQFDLEQFAQKAQLASVKMIEIKLSQGAKPGHGGILPGEKNTPLIAAIRGVRPYETVLSPPCHSAFHGPLELLQFIDLLREHSQGKPIGFKLCLGQPYEFIQICQAMVQTGILPDFITVDGGEGGTGAAPLEYSNSVGMPLLEALALVVDCLNGFDLKQHIRVIASGKMVSGFHYVRSFALGADICNSARAMMLALGCIQSLHCNKNTCPTGIATQNPQLIKGLVVSDKQQRVFNYHQQTVKTIVELVCALGLTTPSQLQRVHVNRRISPMEVKHYGKIYPNVEIGHLLKTPYPDHLTEMMALAQSEHLA